tara:strand:- start:215 stop:1126 length:912 start_codon:yes stop_codon:yes gene_type:complete
MHHWAHNPMDDIRNAGGSLFTSDGILYSYGSHYKMAKQFQHIPATAPVVLFNENTYSPTTGKQRGQAMSACSHMVIIQVPDVDPQSARDHRLNVDWLAEQVGAALQRYKRARLHKNSAAMAAQYARDNLRSYAHYFDIDCTAISDFPEVDEMLAEAAEAERAAAEALEVRMQDGLRAWQQCKQDNVPHLAHRVPPRLRVHNNELQTSHGIRVTLTDDVVRSLMQLWRDVQISRSHRDEWALPHTEGMSHHRIGTWQMDRLEHTAESSYLVSGCHRMAYPQLRRVARMLGLPQTPNGHKLEAVA